MPSQTQPDMYYSCVFTCINDKFPEASLSSRMLNLPPFFFLGQGSVAIGSVASFASAPRADGSIVLAGWTDGDWFGEVTGDFDFAALALDEDGVELWRWQVKHVVDSLV